MKGRQGQTEVMCLTGLWRGGNNSRDQIYSAERPTSGPQAGLGGGRGVGGEIFSLY